MDIVSKTYPSISQTTRKKYLMKLKITFEVKYYSSPLQLSEINKEVAQISNIKGLTIEKIGFIATEGYAEKPIKYDFIDVNQLYDL